MRRPVESIKIKKRRRKTAALTRRNAPKTRSRHISTSIEMELRTSEERWRSLLDNPIFGVTFLDEHQRFVTTSRTFQNMVGYSDEELRLLTPLDISVSGEREINAGFFSEMREGKRQHYEMIKQLQCKSGKLIWVHLYVFAITDRKSGTPIGVLTLTPYDFWRHSHALHHANSGNLDHRGFGDVDALTVPEFLALSRSRRLMYRLYRNPIVMFGVGPMYLFVLQHRLPVGLMRSSWHFWLSTMATNLAIAVLAATMI
jgi:PAS domain S-box-containing protein